MPIVFDPTPTTGDSFDYGGKTWRRMNGYWSALSQSAAAAPNAFLVGATSDWKEVEVTFAPNPVKQMVGIALDYP